MATKLNHDYTITCTDGLGNSVSFRDISGNDLEYLDSFKEGDKFVISNERIFEILGHLSTPRRLNFERIVPRAVRSLFAEVHSHILCNYMSKEIWLRQCYSIQNGSFQNISEMERVPMSKFVAMCMIHKEAMDNIGNTENADPFAE